MRNLLWIAGGAAAIYFLSRISLGKKALFFLRGIRPSGSPLAPVINLDMGVQNPTNQEITIKSITGSIYVNDKYLANVSAFGDQKIGANQESILKLSARPSAIGVFQSIRELLTTPIGNISTKFVGSANVDGLVIPINETQTF